MNIEATAQVDAQRIMNDFMHKTADDCAKVIIRSCELLDTLKLVDGAVVVALIQAASTPGVKMLFEGDMVPEQVAAHFVLLAALEARKRAKKPAPGNEPITPFMQEVCEVLGEPMRKFVDL